MVRRSGPRYVENEWTEACRGWVDWDTWMQSGLRQVEAKWTEKCGCRVDWDMWRLSGLRHVDAEWTEIGRGWVDWGLLCNEACGGDLTDVCSSWVDRGIWNLSGSEEFIQVSRNNKRLQKQGACHTMSKITSPTQLPGTSHPTAHYSSSYFC